MWYFVFLVVACNETREPEGKRRARR
jgi:hypothetical protein